VTANYMRIFSLNIVSKNTP